MSAIDELLGRLKKLDVGVDFASSPPFGTPPEVISTVCRGLCVEGLIILETFLAERSKEWSSHLSASRVSPSSLPNGSKQLEDRLIQTLPRALRSTDVATRAAMISAVGRSLMSLSTSSLEVHNLAFAWPGSNVQAADVEVMLGLIGVKDKYWSEITGLWSNVDRHFPGTSAKGLFDAVTRLRHDAAHDYAANLPIANLSTLSRNVRLIAMCIDVLVLEGMRQIRSNPGQINVRGSSIKVRRIERDGSRWPEYAPGGGSRAYRRHASLRDAVNEATRRAAAKGELVLAFDNSEIVDWRYPVI